MPHGHPEPQPPWKHPEPTPPSPPPAPPQPAGYTYRFSWPSVPGAVGYELSIAPTGMAVVQFDQVIPASSSPTVTCEVNVQTQASVLVATVLPKMATNINPPWWESVTFTPGAMSAGPSAHGITAQRIA